MNNQEPATMRIMKDIMIDIETFGTTPGSAIAQIGAVAFDPARFEFGATFYARCDLPSQVPTFSVSPETVLWWLRQSDDARAEFDKPSAPLRNALISLAGCIESMGAGVRVWGNGAAFDNVLLQEAYRRLDLPVPWDFRHDRCFRTLKNLFPFRVQTPPERPVEWYLDRGLLLHVDVPTAKHNALWDAIRQAYWAMEILCSLWHRPTDPPPSAKP